MAAAAPYVVQQRLCPVHVVGKPLKAAPSLKNFQRVVWSTQVLQANRRVEPSLLFALRDA